MANRENNDKIVIAVDCMGGDHGPIEVAKGAYLAAANDSLEIRLIGPEVPLQAFLQSQKKRDNVSIIPAAEVIMPDEQPVKAIRQKTDASMMVGLKLIKDGTVDALVSTGNTGAIMAGSLLTLGRMSGLIRPALGAVMPSMKKRPFLLLDVGASMDPRPEQLVQYAQMGSIYMNRILGVPQPKVYLLNIGAEESKGNELSKTVYSLLGQTDINFQGNLEARDLFSGTADVVVTEGFTGNVALKLSEGLASGFVQLLRTYLTATLVSKGAALLLKPQFQKMRQFLDYNAYGGAPLFGPRGAVIKCHGNSKAAAIHSGVQTAERFVRQEVVAQMEKTFEEDRRQ